MERDRTTGLSLLAGGWLAGLDVSGLEDLPVPGIYPLEMIGPPLTFEVQDAPSGRSANTPRR